MKYNLPMWLKNIENSLEFDNVYIIHGQEIKDDIVLPSDETLDMSNLKVDNLKFASFKDSLKYTLNKNGFDALITYDINNRFVVENLNDKFSVNSIKAEINKQVNIKFDDPDSEFFQDIPLLISNLNNINIANTLNFAFMIDYYSETDPKDRIAGTHPNVEQMMLATYQHAKTKVEPFLQNYNNNDVYCKHPIIWVVRDTSIIPSHLLSGIGIRQVPITPPSLDDRDLAIEVSCYPYISNYINDENVKKNWKPLFEKAAKAMSGLSLMAISEISKSKMKEIGDIESPEKIINEIINTAKEYRVGLTENPWSTEIVKSRIENGEELLKESVKGQDYAIGKSVDVLKMAALNINGIDSKDAGTAPRGCLFFAGPTGVGKTELAKSIAKMVFGSEDDMIRFDMSEFSESHNAARLIGSPPGYVGNEQGGELTNKVKAHPFSVVLFDEIEKADGSIFDKFLQILSDGRLTDGRGDTVYFSETIIVFTSNKGVTEMQQWLEDNSEHSDEEYRSSFRQHIENFFRDELGRPEIYGRIDEDNIIIFNSIDSTIANQIAELGINNIVENIKNISQIELTIMPSAQEEIIKNVTSEDILQYGGRGIKNALRKVLIKPLSKPLLESQKSKSTRLIINNISLVEESYILEYEN
jgi:DNA polymerase III delta prime subunit